jgi:hypothetical protein
MSAFSVSEPYRESMANCGSLIALLDYVWLEVNRRSPTAAFLLSLSIASLRDEIEAEKPTTRSGGSPETIRH